MNEDTPQVFVLFGEDNHCGATFDHLIGIYATMKAAQKCILDFKYRELGRGWETEGWIGEVQPSIILKDTRDHPSQCKELRYHIEQRPIQGE